jgi:hypothetical protein
MEPVYLLPDEVDYELLIRKRANVINAREKTKLLTDILKREEKGYDIPPKGLLEAATPQGEIDVCKEKICELKKNLSGTGQKQLKTRLLHVQGRLKRLLDTSISTTQVMDAKSLLDSAVELERVVDLAEKKKGNNVPDPFSEFENDDIATNPKTPFVNLSPSSSSTSNIVFPKALSSELSQTVSTNNGPGPSHQNYFNSMIDNENQKPVTPTPTTLQHISQTSHTPSATQWPNSGPENISDFQGNPQTKETDLGEVLLAFLQRQQIPQQSHPKSSPVSHWKITYSGEEGTLKLSEFLAKVEMHAKADHLSETDLVDSAVFLFEGKVARWWQSARKNVSCWSQVVSALKAGFAAPEDDLQIQRKILERRQTQDEPFCVYIADMENLFSNLTFTLSEQQKLTFLKGNMLPFYIEHLSLTPINSVKDLISYCGLLERTRQRLIQLQPPSLAVSTVATGVENQQIKSDKAEIAEISTRSDQRENGQNSRNSGGQNYNRTSNQNRGPNRNSNFRSDSSFRRGRNDNYRSSRTYYRSNNYSRNNRDNHSNQQNHRQDNRSGEERNRNNFTRNFNNTPCQNCGNYGHSAAICFPPPTNENEAAESRQIRNNSQNQTSQNTPLNSTSNSTNPFLERP